MPTCPAPIKPSGTESLMSFPGKKQFARVVAIYRWRNKAPPVCLPWGMAPGRFAWFPPDSEPCASSFRRVCPVFAVAHLSCKDDCVPRAVSPCGESPNLGVSLGISAQEVAAVTGWCQVAGPKASCSEHPSHPGVVGGRQPGFLTLVG